MSGYIRLSKILAKSNGNIFFECPACETPPGINCGGGHGPIWSWDNDVNKPTISPSVLVKYEQYNTPTSSKKKKEHVCHSFVQNGQIQYLSDCTHELAGKLVDIPEWNTTCTGEVISKSEQYLEMVTCSHCKKEYPDFTADSEFIGWHGICAGCALNGVEL